MERTPCITSSMFIINCPSKTRSDLATAMNIQPIIQGGAVCMATAATLAVLTRIWGLDIWSGEDCEPAAASALPPLHERPRHEKALADAGAFCDWNSKRHQYRATTGP